MAHAVCTIFRLIGALGLRASAFKRFRVFGVSTRVNRWAILLKAKAAIPPPSSDLLVAFECYVRYGSARNVSFAQIKLGFSSI